MLHALAILAAAVLCALGYRARGGWNTGINLHSEQLARVVFWGFPCALAGAVAGLGWWALALVPLAWVGSTSGYPWGCMDMGTRSGRYVQAFLGMALKGLLTVAPMLALLVWRGGDWPGLLAAGLAFPLLYWLAYGTARIARLPANFGSGPAGTAPGPWQDAPELGEVLCGAAMGAALAAPDPLGRIALPHLQEITMDPSLSTALAVLQPVAITLAGLGIAAAGSFAATWLQKHKANAAFVQAVQLGSGVAYNALLAASHGAGGKLDFAAAKAAALTAGVNAAALLGQTATGQLSQLTAAVDGALGQKLAADPTVSALGATIATAVAAPGETAVAATGAAAEDVAAEAPAVVSGMSDALAEKMAAAGPVPLPPALAAAEVPAAPQPLTKEDLHDVAFAAGRTLLGEVLTAIHAAKAPPPTATVSVHVPDAAGP